MGREIRRVSPNWEHPKDAKGKYRPLFDSTYRQAIIGHFKELGWYLKRPRYLKEWIELWPNDEYHRPHWKTEPTHYQIYETVSEGTPISPVFARLDEMKVWLLGEGYSEKASQKFVESGWAPSMIFVPGKGVSGLGIHSLDW